MLRKILVFIFVNLIIFVIVSSNSYADRRSFVWTYEYMTMRKGSAEIEYYLTTVVPDLDKKDINTWKHWIEFEYGITDHWDISMYQQFKQVNTADDSDFEYDGFKIRTRYRFAEKGQLFVDLLLYLEYIRNDNLSNPNVLEVKIILAKDIGDFNVAYNQILKQELESGGETENEYAFGVTYEINKLFKLGFESKGNYTEDKYYIGPTAVFTAPEYKFWVSFGVIFGLNNESDDIQTRMILGIPF